MYDFSYHRAGSVDDAVSKLKSADDGKLVAGGMTLIPTLKQRLAQPSDLFAIEFKKVPGLSCWRAILFVEFLPCSFGIDTPAQLLHLFLVVAPFLHGDSVYLFERPGTAKMVANQIFHGNRLCRA